MERPVILCVDDERIILESLKMELSALSGGKCQILTADNGEEALEVVEEVHAEQGKVALVVTDQQMPGMKGIELLRKLRELYPQVYGCLLTGYTDESILNEARESGSFQVLDKPWNVADLTRIMDSIALTK